MDNLLIPLTSASESPLNRAQHTPPIELARSIAHKLSTAQNVLLVGVGGGNDSVTSLLLPAQFERDFGFKPRRLQIAAMLPDVLSYTGISPLVGNIIGEITPTATRSVGGKTLKEFPEPLLAAHKSRFGVERVVGMSMSAGSAGICSALHEFIDREKFDLILACDVGGDFIAAPSNLDVLSPMMDAYALDVFRQLQRSSLDTQFLYCVFGLGTDGESTPAQLREALRLVGNYSEGKFESSAATDVNNFYRNIIELNRRSRTADFTLKSIYGEQLEPTIFRARFHTQPTQGDIKKYYGEFMHCFEDEFAGRYYLFEDLAGVRNPFEFHCVNGIEWFVGIQRLGSGLNHELNGQTYASIEDLFSLVGSTHSVFFGTPSSKFSPEQRVQIIGETAQSVKNRVYDTALILSSDHMLVEELVDHYPLNDSLILITARGRSIPSNLLDLF